jgi:UDP-N-acetylglucosamine 2-epimerase (non-hydrolysing)
MRPLETLWCVAGTRPEAHKLAGVARLLAAHVAVRCVWSAQQPTPPPETEDLNWRHLPAPAHPLARRALEASLATQIEREIVRSPHGALLIQGDTATADATARVAGAHEMPLIHLEAGLRSANLRAPFPEEAYRRRIASHALLNLAPHRRAQLALQDQGVAAARCLVIGSTAIDGLAALRVARTAQFDVICDVHRRENAGRALQALVDALDRLRRRGARIARLAHPNPRWARAWRHALDGRPDFAPLAPTTRRAWLSLAQSARLVLSDSGGAAEELPYLGVPLLVYRQYCERPEAIEAGLARRVHPRIDHDIFGAIDAALNSAEWPPPWPFAASSPFGDGHASARAAQAIVGRLALTPASAA